jgi:hypothetical protein
LVPGALRIHNVEHETQISSQGVSIKTGVSRKGTEPP